MKKLLLLALFLISTPSFSDDYNGYYFQAGFGHNTSAFGDYPSTFAFFRAGKEWRILKRKKVYLFAEVEHKSDPFESGSRDKIAKENVIFGVSTRY